MGVEYKHFIIPADPLFVPSQDIIVNIDNLLSKWKLRSNAPEIFNLTNGEDATVTDPISELRFEGGLALEYPEVTGEIVKEITGESYFKDEVVDEERYIAQISLIVGLDIRIHPSSAELTLTVTEPAMEGNNPIEPYCEYDELLHYGHHAEAYTSTPGTTAPEVEIWVADKKRIIGDQHFSGVWRTAFILDFGKDIPKLTAEIFRIPNLEFMDDLENAMGCKLVEIGEIY